MAVRLGEKYKDSITGFEGIAVARSTWLSGCINVGLEAPAKKGETPSNVQWFDEQRLTSKSRARAGGPQRGVPQQRRG